jgi:hypothetical protein
MANTPVLKLTSAHEHLGCSDGKKYRREEWTITGGEIDPAWRRSLAGTQHEHADPSCRFSLYIVDDVIDSRLSSYGGVVWPTAWTDLFVPHQLRGVEITEQGLALRAAALEIQ